MRMLSESSGRVTDRATQATNSFQAARIVDLLYELLPGGY
jgi:hypothetical protein